MIHVVADQYVEKENLKKFIELAEKLVDETVKEDGCLYYDIHQDINDEKHFSFIEQWESQRHLQAHFERKHFKELVPLIKDVTSKEGHVTVYETIKKA